MNQALESHDKTKLSQIARLVVNGTQSDITNLFDGKLRFKGAGFQVTQERHLESFQLLELFFTVIHSETFRYKLTPRNKVGERVFDDSDDWTGLLDALKRSVQQLLLLQQAQQDLTKESHNFPNVLANTFIARTFRLNDRATVQIVNNESPYLSQDIAFSHAPYTDIVFFYTGVNLYRRPINRQVGFEDFKGWDHLWKRTSLLLGLSVNTLSAGNFESYFGAGSPVIGVGYSVTKITKINAGAMIFKQDHPNPLLDKKRPKVRFFVAISIDHNIKSTLGKLANLF